MNRLELSTFYLWFLESKLIIGLIAVTVIGSSHFLESINRPLMYYSKRTSFNMMNLFINKS